MVKDTSKRIAYFFSVFLISLTLILENASAFALSNSTEAFVYSCKKAELKIVSPVKKDIKAKAVYFSCATKGNGLTAVTIYSGTGAKGLSSLKVKGKLIIFSKCREKVSEIEQSAVKYGAAGIIFYDLTNGTKFSEPSKIPAVYISHDAGEYIRKLIGTGKRIKLQLRVDSQFLKGKVQDKSTSSKKDNISAESQQPYLVRHLPAANWSFLKGELSELPKYNPDSTSGWQIDLRLKNLSKLDLTDRVNDLIHATFDSDTKWPVKDKLPKGYDPNKIMETGMNPGLGIRKLQSEGIDGRGVNIAIIDQGLLIEHIEYKDRIKFYDEVHCTDTMASMHAPFMSSLAVGKNIGVAPGSNLYAIGCTNANYSNGSSELDFTYVAKAIDRVIKVNNTLPKGNKIRALSMSMSFCPGNKGYKELSGAIERAKKQGIFVISANIFESYDHKMWYHGLDRNPLGDPDSISSYTVIPWLKWTPMIQHITGADIYYEQEFNKYNPDEILLVPMCSRTGASPTGFNKYTFYDEGGWSSVEPFLTGLYAMACQVKQDVTPELFWKTALETGVEDEIKKEDKIYTGKIINPAKLIETLKLK